jgi:hypothetical protein
MTNEIDNVVLEGGGDGRGTDTRTWFVALPTNQVLTVQCTDAVQYLPVLYWYFARLSNDCLVVGDPPAFFL